VLTIVKIFSRSAVSNVGNFNEQKATIAWKSCSVRSTPFSRRLSTRAPRTTTPVKSSDASIVPRQQDHDHDTRAAIPKPHPNLRARSSTTHRKPPNAAHRDLVTNLQSSVWKYAKPPMILITHRRSAQLGNALDVSVSKAILCNKILLPRQKYASR
jgi:hypothetical protein